MLGIYVFIDLGLIFSGIYYTANMIKDQKLSLVKTFHRINSRRYFLGHFGRSLDLIGS